MYIIDVVVLKSDYFVLYEKILSYIKYLFLVMIMLLDKVGDDIMVKEFMD